MRDAFGGVFTIRLLLIFLVIYVCFMAVALNYAKAFRTKNGIIDYIERYEGYTDISAPIIDDYVAGMNYYVESQSGRNAEYTQSHGATCYEFGYCVDVIVDAGVSKYVVTTFIEINVLGLSFTVPIIGEVTVP